MTPVGAERNQNMPIYSGKSRQGKQIDAFRADGTKLDRVMFIDTDAGKAVIGVRTKKEDGRSKLVKTLVTGNFYVIDKVSGVKNPPSEEPTPEHSSVEDFIKSNAREGSTEYDKDFKMDREEITSTLKEEGGSVAPLLESFTILEDVRDYLTTGAQALYDSQVGSTVFEYLEGPEGDYVYPVPFHHMAYGGMEVLNTKEGMEEANDYAAKGYQRRTGLVQYIAKQVTTYDTDQVPAGVTRRWASVLSFLEKKKIWQFGILMSTQVLPLALWGDGTPWLESPQSLTVKHLTSDEDPRSYEYEKTDPVIISPEEIKKKGRRILLVSYIGVNPEFTTRDRDDDIESLNERVGNDLFVHEGAAGSDNWSGLPE